MAETLPPEAFGKYELLEKIASGGMAEVYRARVRGIAGFEKILVIKRLADRLAVNKEFTDLFIDEARISVQLQHPNIVQVFELDAVNNQYYMAMEYVQGLDLARLMLRALSHVYQRLSPGGILVLMDYHVPGLTVEGNDSNPGVRPAADAFFADRPERVITLYGGPCSHGYVRKQG